MESPICDLIRLANSSLKDLASVKVIVGEIIRLENNIAIIPISKVKCSFAAGGTEMSKNVKNEGLTKLPFGGATAGNLNIVPIAFLVVHNDKIEVLHLEDNTHIIEKVIDSVPGVVDKIKEMITGEVKDEEVERDKSIKIDWCNSIFF